MLEACIFTAAKASLTMAQAPDPAKRFYVKSSRTSTFVETILCSNGVPPDDARIIAQNLVAANLRGIDAHGIPSYIARVGEAENFANRAPLDPRRRPNRCPQRLRLRGGAHRAMREAIEMARTLGFGVSRVKNSDNFGMMSLVFTNSSSALPVWGGCEDRTTHSKGDKRLASYMSKQRPRF